MNPEFVNLLESLANGVVIADPAGKIIFINRFLEDIFGYEPGKLLGQSVDILLPAEFRSQHARHRTQYNAAPETRLMGAGRDLFARRENGSVFPVEVGLSPIMTSQGPRVVAIVTDISKRKHAEQRSTLQRDIALILSEAASIESVAPKLLETMGITLGWRIGGLWLVDPDTEVMKNVAFWHAPDFSFSDFEEACRRIAFRKGERLLGEIWQHGKPVWISDLATTETFGRSAVAHKAGVHSTFELPILLGLQVFGVMEFFSTEIRPPDTAMIEIAVAVASQISQFIERKRNELALSSLQQQYLQAQKMEAIGRLAGGIAHDFNNLLTVISMSTDVLVDLAQDNSAIRETAKEIGRATDQGAALVRHLMAFSKTQPQTTQSIDVNEVIRSCARILGILAGEDVRFEVDSAPVECRVSMEANRLEQILMNLVANSRDAMPKGGVIRIATAMIDLDAETASRYIGLKPQRYVTVGVSDTGSGIPPEVLPRIFEPFFSTKEDRGTGLGLSSVYGIVRQHDGHIICDSVLNEGTTFTIFLPVAVEAVSENPKSHAPQHVQRGSERVLLVEDQPALRASMQRILEQSGYRLVVASDAHEALAASEQSKDGFDLLVTDIGLPEIKGTELASRLLEQHPRMRVVYMSGYNEEKVPISKGSGFIAKPFRRDALVRKVREVLDSDID